MKQPIKHLTTQILGHCSQFKNFYKNSQVHLLKFSGQSLIISLGLLGTVALQTQLKSVEAIESPDTETVEVATAASWQYASFPVENFLAYTSPFGYRNSPYGGGRKFHYGLDIAAPNGSYIRNWWSGKVVEVSDNDACGTSVTIQSGGWTHIYCHMHGRVEIDQGRRYMVDRRGGIQLWEGQEVSAGTRIGRVGMTGRTTGPHLHWALKHNGSWVDPAVVLRAMYSQQASR